MHWSQVPGQYNQLPDWVKLDMERILLELNDQLHLSGQLPEGYRFVYVADDEGNTDAVAGAGRRDEGEEHDE